MSKPAAGNYYVGFPPRPNHERPKNPTCKKHLQRICGTCAFFEGGLRDAAPALCRHFGSEKMASAKAWDCRQWGRRMIAPDLGQG